MRFAVLATLAGVGACARPNPLYGGVERDTGDVSTSGPSGTRGGGDTTVSATTRETEDGTGASESTTSAESTTEHDTSSSADPPDDTGTVTMPSNLLWVSAPVMGDWDNGDNPCVQALANTDAICESMPVPLVGRSDLPAADLPDAHDFLGEGPFFAAASGTLVLHDFDDLVEGHVEPEFVGALGLPNDAIGLYAWRGPIDQGPASSCEDWTDPVPNGSFWLFQRDSNEISLDGQAPCISELRLLCACAAPP